MQNCSICKQTYEGWGNNAEPYKEGVCCDICNSMYVIPYRLQLAFMGNSIVIKKPKTLPKEK